MPQFGRTVLRRILVSALAMAVSVSGLFSSLSAADLSEQDVKQAIERGKKFLERNQEDDGSWTIESQIDVRIGITSLCVLALLNSGMSPQDPPARRGLQFLRSRTTQDLEGTFETYQTSLVVMALAAARDKGDLSKISALALRLEEGQLTAGNIGSWSYGLKNLGPGDQSNAQFAVLALREAVDAGCTVSRETWVRSRNYWESNQNPDGGWGYTQGEGRGPSRGSMTVAGISSLSITQQMLRTDEDVAPDGTPPCCRPSESDVAIQNGIGWMSRSFTVSHNPGSGGHSSMYYYIYGIERAGRLSGQRFFGDHDWYREGTAMLLLAQNPVDGHWKGTGAQELQPVLGTSFALLFLSKGLAPVLVNKLKYGPRRPNNPNVVLDNDNWNRHQRDVRNLTELISHMPKWPKLLTSQELDLARAVKIGKVNALLQAPVLYITGHERLAFTPAEISLLKEYLDEGGFIFACPTCDGGEFEPSFRELLQKMMPPGEGELKLLPPDHPVYRSEHPLQPEGVKLYGVDFGCRTSVIYSPEDLGCLWDYWAKQDPLKRNVQLKSKIIRSTQIGVNVMAYATGREPPDKTQVREVLASTNELDIERGLLQIAQIKHDGTWNAAPRALKNLLISLNQTVGMAASTKTPDIVLSDKNLFHYPVLYMHGRNRFTIQPDERKQLVHFLERGGVLFADSCCGAKPFDKSFRELMTQLFPNKKLERIPVSHEIFTEKIGRDIKLLKRRTAEGGENAAGGNFTIRTAEPLLEGIEIDGRYAVIYSRYDISCALERQNSGNCEGYLPEDAVKLGTNIVLYAMLQNLRLQSASEPLK